MFYSYNLSLILFIMYDTEVEVKASYYSPRVRLGLKIDPS